MKLEQKTKSAILHRIAEIEKNIDVCYSVGAFTNIADHVPAVINIIAAAMAGYNSATADKSSGWHLNAGDYPTKHWQKNSQSFGILNHIKGELIKMKTYKSWQGSNTEFQLKEKARIIAGTNGGFFSVTYLDKHGNIKNQNARLGVKKDIKGTGKRPDIPGTVLVYKPKKGWRLLYLGNIKAIRAKGADYLFDFQPVKYRT
ncbi:hypothetical protein EOM82_10030 [bacterium]|nr:hypothetical protein [bacterium]